LRGVADCCKGVGRMAGLRITVLRRFKPEEVFGEPPVRSKLVEPCEVFEDGEVVDVGEGLDVPAGFCPSAWHANVSSVMTLHFGADMVDWYDEPGVCVVCCPDGLRPVVFKIERSSTEVTAEKDGTSTSAADDGRHRDS